MLKGKEENGNNQKRKIHIKPLMMELNFVRNHGNKKKKPSICREAIFPLSAPITSFMWMFLHTNCWRFWKRHLRHEIGRTSGLNYAFPSRSQNQEFVLEYSQFVFVLKKCASAPGTQWIKISVKLQTVKNKVGWLALTNGSYLRYIKLPSVGLH